MPSRSTQPLADVSADEPFSWPPLQMPSAVAENSRTHRSGGPKPQSDSTLQDDLKLLDEMHQSRAAPDPAPTKTTSGSTWTQMMDALQSESRRNVSAANSHLNTRLVA